MDFVTFAQENWAVIEQAPWAFVTFGAFCGLAGYLIATKLGAERLAFAQDAAKEWKDRLAGKTPVEVVKQIEQLEQQVALLKPWTLNSQQFAAMRFALSEQKAGIYVTGEGSSHDLDPLYRQMVDVFRLAGWPTHTDIIMDGAPKRGDGTAKPITLLVRDNVSSSVVSTVRKALDAAEIDFNEIVRPADGVVTIPQIVLASLDP